MLTFRISHDRMLVANLIVAFGAFSWARSSMVEQWPFKPLVAGSSPAALTMEALIAGLFYLL